jgi:SAM-dependent methyltransferase
VALTSQATAAELATGERFVPGRSSARIRADHLARYEFASAFASGRWVLDIACGTGYGTRMLREAGAVSVSGVDISADAIAYALEHYGGPGVHFIQADLCHYGVEHAADLICCFETIEHIQNPTAALQSLRRMLASSGVLVISSPNRPVHAPQIRSLQERPPSAFHVCEFTPSELRALLAETGFSVRPATFGQRFSPRLPRSAHRLYGRLLRPAVRASPVVRRQRFWESPRYFVLVAG